MLRLLVSLVALGLAAGQLHNTCNNNAHYSEAQVITLVANICDRNHDGVYTEAEIFVGFCEILHKHLPVSEAIILGMDSSTLVSFAGNSGFAITRLEFVSKWHLTFHDSLDFAGATFDAFDSNQNEVWSVEELDSIAARITEHFDNGDGIITHSEFEAFFTHVYGC